LHGLEALRREIAEREADEAAFPEEARREPDEVRELLRQAREEAGRCDERFQHARQEHGLLTSRRKQREAYREQLLDAEREHNLYALLSQLLGRDRLQRHLVRQAERQIVDYANAVLDRLSAGELCLRLCGGDD